MMGPTIDEAPRTIASRPKIGPADAWARLWISDGDIDGALGFEAEVRLEREGGCVRAISRDAGNQVEENPPA